VLWKAGPDVLPGLGAAWSTPAIARARIAGAAQNGEHFVLVFGGGYDAAGGGNRIFIVDAASGRLLWSAGAGTESGADLVLTEMTHSMAARVAVLDTDGDAYADRMYAVDVSGIVWRFDIWNGRARSEFVTGGVLADLSEGEEESMFFNAPDVALVQPRDSDAYYNVAVGSGGMSVATGRSSHDYFYSVRDKAAFVRLPQVEHDRAVRVRADELIDIAETLDGASIAPDAPGWKLDLRGAQVAGDSITANGVVLFTSFQSSTESGECVVGSSRVYAVRIDTGAAGVDFNDDGVLTKDDLSVELPTTGPPGEVRVVLGMRPAATGAEPKAPGPQPGPPDGADAPASGTQCLVGTHVLSKCVSAGALMRTHWHRRSVR
jgi:type IV pilus assembly protein PilY1